MPISVATLFFKTVYFLEQIYIYRELEKIVEPRFLYN